MGNSPLKNAGFPKWRAFVPKKEGGTHKIKLLGGKFSNRPPTPV